MVVLKHKQDTHSTGSSQFLALLAGSLCVNVINLLIPSLPAGVVEVRMSDCMEETVVGSDIGGGGEGASASVRLHTSSYSYSVPRKGLILLQCGLQCW